MYWGLKFNYQYGRPYHFQFQAVNRRQKMLLQINSIKKKTKRILEAIPSGNWLRTV